MKVLSGNRFARVAWRGLWSPLLTLCLLFIAQAAHAACPSLEPLRGELKSAQGVSATDADALLEAQNGLQTELSGLGKVLPECQGKANKLKAEARKELSRLAKLIAEAEKVVINIAQNFEGESSEEDASLFLNGKPIQGTRITPGHGRHELTVQLATPARRVLSVKFKLNGAELSPHEKTESTQTFIVSTEESGSYEVSLTIIGEEIPDPMALDIMLKPKNSPVSFVLDGVPIDVDKPIRLDEKIEEHRLVISHPETETGDGWFRLGAKLNDAKFKAKSEEPTETVYMIKGEPGKTLRFKLRTAEGPYENPARPYVIAAGAGLIVLGGLYGILQYLDASETEDKGIELFEDKDCGDVPRDTTICTPDVEEDVNDYYEEADDTRVWGNVGFIVAGVGALTAIVGLFVLESGEDPPRLSNAQRATQFASARDPLLQNVRVVPQWNPKVVGAQFSATF